MSSTALNRASSRLKAGEQSKLLLAAGAAAVLIGLIVASAKWLYLAALGAFLVSLFWPVQIALGVFGLLVPFDNIAVLSSAKSGTTLTYLVGAGAAAILLATGLGGKRLAKPPRAAYWWAAFVLWASTSALWALDPRTSQKQLPTVIALLLLYLVAVSVRVTKKELRAIGLFIILGGTIAAAYAASQYGKGVYYHNSTRASLNTGGRETDPNEFAASLMLPMSLAIGGFISTRKRLEKACMLGALGVMGMIVLLTESRGALVALSVLVLVFLLRYRIRMRMLIPLCVLTLGLLFMPETFYYRLTTAISSGGAGRLYIWKVGLIIIRHFGIFGVGLANFPVAYDLFPGHASIFMHYGKASHNIYLNVWAETGIIGLLLLFAAVRSQLRAVAKLTARRWTGGSSPLVPYEAACWAMLAAGFFLDITYKKDFWLLWILLPLAVRAWTGEQRDTFNDRPDSFRNVS